MESADSRELFDAYKKFHNLRSSRALAAQIEALAEKARIFPEDRIGAPIFADNQRPPPIRGTKVTTLFDGAWPYTSGSPYPETRIRTRGSPSNVNIEALADASLGRISVGVCGGRLAGGGFGSSSHKPVYLEMPDRWSGGDAINSSASILQTVVIPNTQSAGSQIVVGVDLGWNPIVSANGDHDPSHYLDGCLLYNPGLNGSALSGFVGVSVNLELAVTQSSATGLLTSSVADQNVLNLGINTVSHGAVDDEPAAPFLFRDWAFEPDPTRIISLTAGAPLASGATQVIVEVTVRLAGMRGGVNDPNGGFINAAFADLRQGGAVQTVGVPVFACPFSVNRIQVVAKTP